VDFLHQSCRPVVPKKDSRPPERHRLDALMRTIPNGAFCRAGWRENVPDLIRRG
jgi:hypothetical protein